MSIRPVWLTRCVLCALALGLTPRPLLAADTASVKMEQLIDTFFVGIKSDFDKVKTSGVLVGGTKSAVNALFLRTLKKHQPFYSLMRTDAKGKTVSEVVRIEGPAKQSRNLSDQPWFKEVSVKHEEHAGFMKEDNGRYYIFWAFPLMSKAAAGKEKFLGAVAAKIDIWDCFQEFAKKAPQPFLIKVNSMSLYDHEWKTAAAVEEPLTIPGVEGITVRYPRPQPAGAAVAAPVAPSIDSQALLKAKMEAEAAKAAQDSAAKVQASKDKTRRLVLIGIAAVIILVLLVLLVRLSGFLKNYFLMRKIDKEI